MAEVRRAYPPRNSNFAHTFVRTLHDAAAAQEIGAASCYLLCTVAHAEQGGRYSGPAFFWREQLMGVLGFKSPKQLLVAREKAVEAGWLDYYTAGHRSIGEYFVTFPASIRSPGGTNGAPSFVPLAERMTGVARSVGGTQSGTLNGTQSGPLPLGGGGFHKSNKSPPPGLVADVYAFGVDRAEEAVGVAWGKGCTDAEIRAALAHAQAHEGWGPGAVYAKLMAMKQGDLVTRHFPAEVVRKATDEEKRALREKSKQQRIDALVKTYRERGESEREIQRMVSNLD